MRVMMTTDMVGGVWTYTRDLTEGLINEGHEILLISLGAPNEEQRCWIELLSDEAGSSFRYIATDFKLEWMPDGHHDLGRSTDFLLRLMRQEQPDIFHSNQLCYGALPCDIPKIVVAHSDVISWWYARYSAAPPADAWFSRYRHLVENGLQRADVVVAPTTWVTRQLTTHYGVSADACRAISNGRNCKVRIPRRRQMQALTACRVWDEGKNIGLLADAALDLPMVIVGDTGGPRTCARVTRMTLNPKMRFAGALPADELATLMEQSAIYISPSLYEPFGLAPLEAAFAGCALVLSDIPTFREVWHDAAAFFDPHDAADLTRVANDVARDARRCSKLAAAAQARAARLYSAEGMTQRYLELYAEVCAGREIAHVA